LFGGCVCIEICAAGASVGVLYRYPGVGASFAGVKRKRFRRGCVSPVDIVEH
jgi:hypothetical protein